MTSTFGPNYDFTPDLDLPGGGPQGSEKHDASKPSGMEELFLYSPWTQSGEVTFFNWFNANISWYDGVEVSAKKSAPGWTGKMFSKLPDDAQFATERPNAIHGKNATSSPDKIFIADERYIPDLFKHTYTNKKRWELCWRGKYQKGSGGDWYQYFNAAVYNTSDVLYPFATKGISLRLRVPGSNEETLPTGEGDNDNYGNNMIINRAFGLWRDLDGKYYIYRMYCHGDNRYKAYGKSDGDGTDDGSGEEGSKVRPEKGTGKTTDRYPDRIKPATARWWGDRYWFIDEDYHPRETTNDALEKNMIAKGKEKGVIMFTNEDVENLYFCGFSLELHHNRKAGSKRNHSYLISRLTPVPYYAPRHSPNIKAVLGEPTPMSELRQGHKKIHFWKPPNVYYDWVDDLDYDTSEPIEDSDTITGDGDTIWANVEDVFVDENGDGIAVPSTVFQDNNRIIVNSKGEVLTTDDSEFIIESIAAQYAAGEETNNDDPIN